MSTSLASIIRAQGLTFRQIAAAGGPSPATMTRLLRGERQWRPEWVEAVARLLDVEPEELLAGVIVARQAGRQAIVGGGPRDCAEDGDELLTTDEAARELKCSTSFLYRRTDIIPPLRLGGRRRYRRSDLLLCLEGTRGSATCESHPARSRSLVTSMLGGGRVSPGIRRGHRRR